MPFYVFTIPDGGSDNGYADIVVKASSVYEARQALSRHLIWTGREDLLKEFQAKPSSFNSPDKTVKANGSLANGEGIIYSSVEVSSTSLGYNSRTY